MYSVIQFIRPTKFHSFLFEVDFGMLEWERVRDCSNTCMFVFTNKYDRCVCSLRMRAGFSNSVIDKKI